MTEERRAAWSMAICDMLDHLMEYDKNFFSGDLFCFVCGPGGLGWNSWGCILFLTGFGAVALENGKDVDRDIVDTLAGTHGLCGFCAQEVTFCECVCPALKSAYHHMGHGNRKSVDSPCPTCAILA